MANSTILLCVLAQLMLVFCSVSGHGNHGGVPMGIINVCDDAVTNIEVDWDPQSSEEYTCDGGVLNPAEPKIDSSCEETPQEGIHECLPTPISYNNTLPTSGHHRPNWPKYGEYIYAPPQRWLHAMEHGAIVMLYHPCADVYQVELLRQIVTKCLYRHIITPSKLLPPETPFALFSWGCKVMMSSVVSSVAGNFIKMHGTKGPEQVWQDGQYDVGQIVKSQIVSDKQDSVICPPHTGQDSIVDQSTLRRAKLTSETVKLQKNMDRLIATYKRVFQP